MENKIFDLEDLKPIADIRASGYKKTEMQIAGYMFEFYMIRDLSGDFACWSTEDNKYIIYATPGYENISVPVDVRENEDFEDTIGDDNYDEPIYTFEEYCTVVKALATKIILIHEMKQQREGDKEEEKEEEKRAHTLKEVWDNPEPLVNFLDLNGIDLFTVNLQTIGRVIEIREKLPPDEDVTESDEEMQQELIKTQQALLEDSWAVKERYEGLLFQIQHLKEYIGTKMIICDMLFTLCGEIEGLVPHWLSPGYEIEAIPWEANEDVSLYVQIQTMDENLGTEYYLKPIFTFDQYCAAVKALATKMILLFEMEQKIREKIVLDKDGVIDYKRM